MKEIESELGLTRQQLIRMALLLGSDYTEGVSGIGIVNAIEVVHAFPEEDGLRKFKEWIESPDPSILGKLDIETGSRSKKRKAGRNDSDGKEKGPGPGPDCIEGSDDKQPSNGTERIKEIFMSKHRNVSKNWHIPASFPSESVISAYISPQVDNSTEPFSWGRPDLALLRKLCWERFGWDKEKADELLLPVLREYNKHETQLRMEAFYSFNERFAKIRSKRIKKAIKGITGKSFNDTDEPDEDNPSTSKTTKKKVATSSTGARGRGKRNNNAGVRNMESQENNKIGSQDDNKVGDSNSFADTVELTKENNNTKKRRKKSPSSRSKGRGQSRLNAGHWNTENKEDSDTKYYTSASDDISQERQASSYKSEGMVVRRSNRKRKQVTYVEDGNEADDNDVPFHQDGENDNDVPIHQDGENDSSEASGDMDMAGQDTQYNLMHHDASELNSNQMHPDPSTTEDVNEDFQGFELHEDHVTPKEYLFTGGGFCTEGDEQDQGGDAPGPEMEPGRSDACDGIESIDGVSDSGKSTGQFSENAGMEARGESSSQKRTAIRGLSAMPMLTKRRRKS